MCDSDAIVPATQEDHLSPGVWASLGNKARPCIFKKNKKSQLASLF